MRRIITLLLALFVIVFAVFFIGKYYYNPFGPSEKVNISSRIDGYFLGSVDNNGGRTFGLHPCVKNISEVKKVLNQLISYNKCYKDNLHCERNSVVELLTDTQIDSNFEINQFEDYFEIRRINSDFNFYLQSSNNPEVLDQVPELFYVCNSDYIKYLNTGFADSYQRSYYYPYSIDQSALHKDSRKLLHSYLQNPNVGVAKVSSTRTVDKVFLENFMDLLYEIGYFRLGGFNTSGEIVRRDVSSAGDVIRVQDEVLFKTFNDIPPFQTTTSKLVFSIQYSKNSQTITSNRERLE